MTDTSPEATTRKIADSPRPELIAGIAVIAAFFVVFLGWAALAPLDAGAYAQGQIAVSGNRQAVQHREGGTVQRLNVAEGDNVTQGQVLLELSSGEIRASERGVTGQIVSLLAQRARMIAERDGLASIPTPPDLTSLPPEDQPLADEAMRLQRLQFSARRTGRATERGVLDQRIGQLDQQVLGYQRQIEANLEQRRLIGEELAGMRELAAKGYAPQNRVRALERAAASLDGDLGNLRAQVARAREAMGETRLQSSGIATRTNEEIADGLRQIDVQLNDLRPRQTELRQQIARSQIRAPATGQVVGLTIFTPGGVIQPGQTLMSIVPDNAAQIIVASLNPADIDDVKVGLSTEVRFPGLHDRSAPILHGTVTRVSADAFTDEATGRSFFRCEVIIPPEELDKLGNAAEHIRTGMPAEVIVLLRKRTALEYLVEPLTRSLWRSGSGV
jgi:HlyD family secretion protein